MIKKNKAFTLAEILLTMTIVGVVAAMTIPTLHYNRVKKEYTAKLKNFYSKMNNAILDMEMDYGSFKDLQRPDNGQGYNWYMKYIDPYMGHEFVKENSKEVYYKDGSKLMHFTTGGCLDVYYDINGDKGPNRHGYDRQTFLFCYNKNGRESYFGSDESFFGTYVGLSGVRDDEVSLIGSNVSRQQMIDECRKRTSTCSRLLQNDQWEFKDDYPFKF